MEKQQNTYDASQIKVLKGLDPIKLNPGQFTRTDSPLHMIQEVLDNAVDEALAGYADQITIELLNDKSIKISDNGRGIPVDMHSEGVPVIQAIFTVMYSGGKFDKSGGAGAYKFAGGLHGVGVSVTNALSNKLVAQVKRNGCLYEIEFSNGDIVKELHVVKNLRSKSDTGTSVIVEPNPTYFDDPSINKQALIDMLKTKAVILPNVKTCFIHGDEVIEFSYQNGLTDYLSEILDQQETISPSLAFEYYLTESDLSEDSPLNIEEGINFSGSWLTSGDGYSKSRSFVNLIPTPQHGTHVIGLKNAVFNAVKNYAEHTASMPKGVKLSADDCFKTLCFVLSVKMVTPKFDNQTKDRLYSKDAIKLVETIVQPKLENWLNKNPTYAASIVEQAIASASARHKTSNKEEKRKSSSVVLLPGKLTDCSSKNAEETELFLVEGDSAGGSAKMGRSKDTQAILPLRGKVLNGWEETKDSLISNKEMRDISTAIGVDAHSQEDTVDFSRLRYTKICILSDADDDGLHIQVLLLTNFLRHFPQLIDKGYIYVAQPPLFKVDVAPSAKKRASQKIYAMTQDDLEKEVKKLDKAGIKNYVVGRFKGLGEMNAEELWDTTLNPDTRTLFQIQIADKQKALELFNNLMHSQKADWRRQWLEQTGFIVREVELDPIL